MTPSGLPERYEIIKSLGSGLTGEVYLVKDKVLKKELALKLFKNCGRLSAREFKTLSRLDHQNIVKVHDFGLTKDERLPFFTEEYIEGSDLISASRGWSCDEKMRVIIDIAKALFYLHSNGVRHGDIKPSNILVSATGVVKLLDLGTVGGTPAYVSPEQIDGKVPDWRSDLYSFGVVILELFSGKNPFLGKDAGETLTRHKRLVIKDHINGKLGEIAKKLLEKDPNARLQGADEVLFLLSARPELTTDAVKKDPLVERVVSEAMNNRGAFIFAGFSSETESKRAALEVSSTLQIAGRDVIRWKASSDINLLDIIQAHSRRRMIFDADDRWQLYERALSVIKDTTLVLEGMSASGGFVVDFLKLIIERRPVNVSIVCIYESSLVHRTRFEELLAASKGKSIELVSSLPVSVSSRIKRIEDGLSDDDAAAYLKDAATSAMQVHDYEGAVSLLRRAVEKKSSDELFELLLDAATKAGDNSLAISSYDRISKPSFNDKIKRSLAFSSLGRNEESEELLASIKPSNEREEAVLKDRRLRAWLKVGRYSDIIKEGAVAEDPVILNTVGLAYYYLGRFKEAESSFKKVQSSKARPSQKASAMNYLGMVAYNLGDIEKAKKRYKEAANAFEKISHPLGMMSATTNLAAACHLAGEYKDALSFYLKAISISKDTSQSAIEASLHSNLANLYLAICSFGDVEKELAKARELSRKSGSSIVEGYNDLVEADLLMATGDNKKARSLILSALKRFENLKAAREICLSNLSLGRASRNAKEACGYLEKADVAAVKHGFKNERSAILLAMAEKNAEENKKDVAVIDGLRDLLKDNEAGTSKEMLWEIYHHLGDRERAKETIMWLSSQVPLSSRENYLKDKRRAKALAALKEEGREEEMELNSLKRLLEINKRLTAELSTEKVLTFIMDSVVELTGGERGFLLLKDAKGELKVPVARNVDAEDIKKPKFKISRSIAERVIRRGEPLLTTDALADSRFKAAESVHALKLRSVMSVPMRYRNETMGAIYVDNRYQSGLFDENDLEVLTAFADQAAIAYINAKFYEEKEKANAEIAELNRKLESVVARQSLEIENISTRLTQTQKDLELKYQYKNMIGRSPAMQNVFQLLDRVTDTDSNVLVTGESGTGKELVARAIHYNGPRKDRQFVSVNCAAIPANLLESELFGHKKGSFTGALSDKTGLFEQASGGTIFLDEIGDMPLDMQSKLLRAIQQKEIRRVGSNQSVVVDVRVIAATNRELSALVSDKKFREDLFYRLNVLQVKLPALKERREDIPLLIEHFLKGKKEIEPDAMKKLMNYSWPGNIRELENVIERAIIMSGDKIKSEDIAVSGDSDIAIKLGLDISSEKGMKEAKASVEKKMILDAIDGAKGNKARAAKALGISRYGLYKKLERYKIV